MMVVDASVWVSAFYLPDGNHAASRAWLQHTHQEDEVLAAPILLLAEVAGAIARRTQLPEDGLGVVERMIALSNLRLVVLDRTLALAAARVASAYFLRGADAAYVAVAEYLGVPLITWDHEQLRRGKTIIQVLRPDLL